MFTILRNIPSLFFHQERLGQPNYHQPSSLTFNHHQEPNPYHPYHILGQGVTSVLMCVYASLAVETKQQRKKKKHGSRNPENKRLPLPR